MSSRKWHRWTILAILTVPLLVILLSNLEGPQATADTKPSTRATISPPWHTFLGTAPASPDDSDDDYGYGITTDSDGYAYVVGQSMDDDWGGTLIITHALGLDGFLAKLDSQGNMLWHTFIGGSETDSAQAITLDDNEDIFVVGTSNGGDWGSEPISDAHTFRDVFVAKFDANGERQWFTFVGTDDEDLGHTIAVDSASNNVYVGGVSGVKPYLAKLNSAGEFQWQRVITSATAEGDLGPAQGIAVDQSGDVYLTGFVNYGEWHGASPPVRPHAGPPDYVNYSDAFVAKFDGDDGTLLWHTFLGASEDDQGYAIALQKTSPFTPTVYVAGWSADSWGTPIQPHTGSADAFVAQLNGVDGTLAWHTFVGNVSREDTIHAIALDDAGRPFAAGASYSGWGRPVIPHPGDETGDAVFVAAFSTDGHFLGNTFMGGASSQDIAASIAFGNGDALYVAGSSSAGWDNPGWDAPIRAFSGDRDAFVARLGTRSVVRYWLYQPLVLKNHAQ